MNRTLCASIVSVVSISFLAAVALAEKVGHRSSPARSAVEMRLPPDQVYDKAQDAPAPVVDWYQEEIDRLRKWAGENAASGRIEDWAAFEAQFLHPAALVRG